ncbi:hypothetical protein TL16_g06677 [Triparma laevis f. inornata]|uniref:Uncharacterized protein n=1 Tax=Triparma laevis f. inornata TaxID=1714386 RepID=A0A9W7EDX3_9STRA|nr:hypothetical protein TL16_g06677 [Triparma laevis f. inornata]
MLMIEFVRALPPGEDIDCESLLRKFFKDKTSAVSSAVALPGEGLIHEAVKRGWWQAADELLSRGALGDFKKLNSMISDAAQYDNDQLNRVLRKHLDVRKREAGKTTLGSPSLHCMAEPDLSSLDYLPLPPGRSTVTAPKHLSEIDTTFVASTSWMENTQTVKIHDNYMNWGTETKIENLIYLLDNLKKREKTLQHDLVDATDAKGGAKELLIQAHEILSGEEAKISDRIWLIKVLELEVRTVIEQLNDKVQALKSIQKMEIDNSYSSSSKSSSGSPSTSSPPKDRVSPSASHIYSSPSRNSSSFNFDPSSLERESSVRLNKLLNNANSISVTDLHDRTLADIRGERGQVQGELENIIGEREVLIQKLHKIQSFKAAASLPPSRPTDKIKMTRSPHLTPPSAAVFERVNELDRERFQLDELGGGRGLNLVGEKNFDRESRRSSSVASTSRSISGGSNGSNGNRSVVSDESTGSGNSEVFIPISPALQMFDKQEVCSGDSMYRITTLDSPVGKKKKKKVMEKTASSELFDISLT